MSDAAFAAWNALQTQSDLDGLLDLFGYFHDGCLREAHVWTEYYVHPDLHMNCSFDLDTRIRLLIQRQYRGPSAIELLFERVTTFHLRRIENYDSIIFDATLLHDQEMFYWADASGWSPKGVDRNDVTWIAAKKLSWRDASDWMGEALRYGGNGLP